MLPSALDRRNEAVNAASLLAYKLNSLTPIADEDREFLASTVPRPRMIPAGVLMPEARRLLGNLVVGGWAGRLRLFADGRRQVVSTMISGEIVALHANPYLSNTTVALTDVLLSDMTPVSDALDRAPDRYPRLRRALRLAANLEEAQITEQVVSLGCRPAYERLAYWLLDIEHRLTLAGLCSSGVFRMSLTQDLLADICGMSIVHVNRVMKQLRRERMIDLRGGMLTILDPERMQMLAEYAPPSLAAEPGDRRTSRLDHYA